MPKITGWDKKSPATRKTPYVRPKNLRYAQVNQENRHAVDDYPTPFAYVERLIDDLGLDPATPVHEPCAGGGWTVAHLRRLGFDPTFEDLIYSGVDYLDESYEPPETGWVITNPPYKLAEKFVRKALTHTTGGVALLMNASFIEALGRARGLFAEHPPTTILVNARKMKLRNGDPSIFSHYWLVWDRAFPEGPTQLRWVIPEGETQMPTGMAPGVWALPEES